jgi:PKHD-type hydroxylase
MLLHIPQILSTDELREVCVALARASWVDGRVTAGPQSAAVKNNEQLPITDAAMSTLQNLVLAGLNRSERFFSAALPKRVFPPLFNRYGGISNSFGDHVDNAVRFIPGGLGDRVRTDLSCTLFLSDPDDYEGGELVVQDSYNSPRIKLPAGDLLLYPSTHVHRVEPVTRGVRLASFFWVESMVRSAETRRLLFDMDTHLMTLRTTVRETHAAVVGLTGTYHNLLRMWSDV